LIKKGKPPIIETIRTGPTMCLICLKIWIHSILVGKINEFDCWSKHKHTEIVYKMTIFCCCCFANKSETTKWKKSKQKYWFFYKFNFYLRYEFWKYLKLNLNRTSKKNLNILDFAHGLTQIFNHCRCFFSWCHHNNFI
jgi:hypothetical protein